LRGRKEEKRGLPWRDKKGGLFRKPERGGHATGRLNPKNTKRRKETKRELVTFRQKNSKLRGEHQP